MAEIINFFENGEIKEELIPVEHNPSRQSLLGLLFLTKSDQEVSILTWLSVSPSTEPKLSHWKIFFTIGRNRSRGIYVDIRRAIQPKRGSPFMTILSLSTSYNRPQEQHLFKILNLNIE